MPLAVGNRLLLRKFPEIYKIFFRSLFPLSVAIFLHPTAVRLNLAKPAKRIFTAIGAKIEVKNIPLDIITNLPYNYAAIFTLSNHPDKNSWRIFATPPEEGNTTAENRTHLFPIRVTIDC